MRTILAKTSFLTSLFLAFFVLASCASTDTEDVRKKKVIMKEIEAAESKVNEASKSNSGSDAFEESREELMTLLLEFYHSYPKEKYAAECVTKIHMLHSAMGNTEEAVAYADTLLEQYPKAENRAQIIESQILAYEMMVKPRDVNKIKGYLELWLLGKKKKTKQKKT
mmetsp:Transcript_2393/g.3295  ORF Transcript_2393/g.3295 Transcript_2393/m.3295 type:complete len:167 (+) Transcript_2393:583-1083(+)